MGFRHLAKRSVEALARASGLPGYRLRTHSPSVVVLSYHNVVPRGESPVGDLSLHIPQARFAEHLDLLLDTHDVVSLEDAFDPDRPEEGRPVVVVTFDDAYRGALTAGVEEMVRRGLPATVFAPAGLLGGDGFWWDLLAPGNGRTLDDALRSRALTELAGDHDRVLSWATRTGIPVARLPEHARPVDLGELRDRLASAPGWTVGSHTWSHVNLGAVTPEVARDQILRGHRWLDGCAAPTVDWLAYPYGIPPGESADWLLDEMSGALLVEGGRARISGRWSGDRLRVPRVNVSSGVSRDGLLLRLAGFI